MQEIHSLSRLMISSAHRRNIFRDKEKLNFQHITINVFIPTVIKIYSNINNILCRIAKNLSEND